MHEDTDEDVGVPRWVKWFGAVAAVLVAALVVLHLAGLSPGGHAP